MASGNKWLERAGWAVASQGIGEETVGLARPKLAAGALLGNSQRRGEGEPCAEQGVAGRVEKASKNMCRGSGMELQAKGRSQSIGTVVAAAASVHCPRFMATLPASAPARSCLSTLLTLSALRLRSQVFCNALVPTILAIVYGVLAGCVDVPLGPLPSLEPWRAKAVTALMGGFLVGAGSGVWEV